ncbi:transglutaminase domain-containing protein [Bacteroides sp. 214]|uniref:transglutaminase domain-containing protein n=1 Tax=Bacteroides sp. 214 TaxID=2302935 RepID=UPI0013D7E9A0|nr:transglutaminase domain-containing protein [Bacteroides sp. 214]
MEETFAYELNKKGEVQISSEHLVNYKCIKPATVSFFEYYDNYSEIKNVKIKGIKRVHPQYGMYKRENIFFSDGKACYFDIPFIQKDSEAIVTFNKLYKDIRRFTFIPLAEAHHTESRTIKIVIPDWMNVDILNQNLSENITINSIKDDVQKATITTIHITNQPAAIIEEHSPHYMHSQPYIIIIPRESLGKAGNTRYFKTIDDLYEWSKEPLSLMDNNLHLIKEKASELTANCKSDEEKINVLCQWVQRNIRYIAFEDGISAFKPDNAQDVITQKYGDCKGMSNLLKSLLIAKGFDVRLVWVATADVERDLDIANPSPFANHMICALCKDDSLYYFDPTVKSLSFGEIPEQLQGQKALIEDGENYIISQIPQFSAHYNRDSLFVQYSITDNKLTGKANRSFEGEAKHSLSYWMNSMTETEKKQKTEQILKNGEMQDSIFNIETNGLESFLPEINIKYEIKRKSNINIFGNQIFINLDDTKDYQNAKVDIKNRKTALKLPHKDYVVVVSQLLIPEGYDVNQLPENKTVSREKYSFSISYKKEKDTIIYHKEMFVFNSILEKSDFEQWNSDIDALRKAYGELIVLEKSNNKK